MSPLSVGSTWVLSGPWVSLFLADAFAGALVVLVGAFGQALAVAVRAVSGLALIWRRLFAFAIPQLLLFVAALTPGVLVPAAFAGWQVPVDAVVRDVDLELSQQREREERRQSRVCFPCSRQVQRVVCYRVACSQLVYCSEC